MTRWQLFWRNLLLHLRRAPRDMRSLRYLGYLIYLVAYGTYLGVTVFYYGLGPALFGAVMLAIAFCLALLIKKSNSRTDEAMLRLAPQRHSIELPEPKLAHVKALQKLLLKRAIFADRAGAEAMLRNGVLPDTALGITRRRTIDLARSSGVWEGLTGQEQDSLLAQEGSWSNEQTNRTSLWAEDVRVLRWVLGMDQVLMPFEFVVLDFLPVVEVTSGKVRIGDQTLASYDVLQPREEANRVLMRGLAEGSSRGIFQVDDEDARVALQAYALESSFAMEDILVGNETFAKADDERVRWVTQLAGRRSRTLNEALEILRS